MQATFCENDFISLDVQHKHQTVSNYAAQYSLSYASTEVTCRKQNLATCIFKLHLHDDMAPSAPLIIIHTKIDA